MPNNVTAVLCNGDEPIAYTPVLINGGTYESSFKFTNLDLTNFGGKQLKVRLESPLDTPSDFVFINVANDGSCVSYIKPIVTDISSCASEAKSVSQFTCVSTTKCAIAIIDTQTREIVATTINSSLTGETTYESSALAFDSIINPSTSYKGIAVSIGEPTEDFPQVTFDFQCNKILSISRVIEGFVPSVDKGIILMYESDFAQADMPVASAPINDGKFKMRFSSLYSGKYVLYALKLEY